MQISEIYRCLQMEGLLLGTPSILLRASLCNLKCHFRNGGLCDSSFTWDPKNGKEMDVQQVYDEVVKLAMQEKEKINFIIYSGGEPTIQKEFPELCQAFLLSGFHLTVETNGTKYVEIPTKVGPKNQQRDLTANTLFSISPKLNSSVPVGTEFEKSHDKARINLVVLEALLKRYPSYLKFVITGDDDIKEVLNLKDKLKVPNHRIFLMPEGTNRDIILERSKSIIDMCLKYNFRFSPREHVNIFGNMRGV